VARRTELENAILGALVERVGEFELPSDLVDKEIESAEKRRGWELRMQGKSEREAEDAVAEERVQIRTEVEKMLRHFFLVDEIARREGIKITERDIEARIARLAAARGMQPRQVREELEKAQVMPQLYQDLLDQKTRTWLRENADVEEID
jgi:trigger factor